MHELISVCIPVYNGEKYLAESIESVINQTYSKLEIIIVDDQSTDDSLAIAENYQAKDPRVRIVRNASNLGLVENWNKCIFEAKTNWLKLHFQDDLMEAYTIEEMMGSAERFKTDLVLSDRSYFFEGEEVGFYKNLIRPSMAFDDKAVIKPKDLAKFLCDVGLKYNFLGEPLLGLINRRLLERYGVFDSRFKQIGDFEFWLRIGLNEDFVYLSEPLHKFRVHEDSQSSKNSKSSTVNFSLEDRMILCRKFLENSAFANLRKTVSAHDLNKLIQDMVSTYVRRNGYSNGYRRLNIDLKRFFKRSPRNLSIALWQDFLLLF